MLSPSEFADRVGRKKIAEALNVGQSAVSEAITRGLFSASWFDPLEKMARDEGIACPRSMFKWRKTNGKTKVFSDREGGS